MDDGEAFPKRRRRDDPASSPAQDAAPEGVLHSSTSSFKVPGLFITDHLFKVPLDHTGGVEGEIDLFVREVVSPSLARRNIPYLLYLQGGPGFESPRPTEASAWLKSATAHFRVILMDQRGTGRSSQINTNTLQKLATPQQQADHLQFFRADNIVKDAELVRKTLVPKDNHGGKWSVLGQSFGGFCCLTYLSFAPDGLLEVLLTGGIPPAINEACSAEATYRALAQRVLVQNQRYYFRFPDDVKLVQEIVKYLERQPEGGLLLPSGTLLTPRVLQLLGLQGLGSGGGFERLHYLLESFFDDTGDASPAFIKNFQAWLPWDANILYVLLHEAIYCQGAASKWAAHRVRQDPELSAAFDASSAANAGRPVYFTGEMVFPWMFDDLAYLRPFKEAADLVALKEDWPPLYDAAALQGNKVPVVAATYLEDMYVDYNLAQATASQVAGLRQWVTNEFKHSGIRDDGARIFDRLLNMVRDSILPE